MSAISSRPALLAAITLGLAMLAGSPARAQTPRYQVSLAPGHAVVTGGTRVELKAQLFRKGDPTYSKNSWRWTATGGVFEKGDKTSPATNVWVAPHRPGRYEVQVTTRRARDLGQYGRAVFIVRPKSRNLRITPTRIRCEAGQVARLHVSIDGGVTSWDELHWEQVTGGTLKQHTMFQAGPTAGVYTLVLKDRVTGETARCDVEVIYPPTRCAEVVRLRPGQVHAFRVDHHGARDAARFRWTQVAGGRFTGWNQFQAGAAPGNYDLILHDATTGQNIPVRVVVEVPLSIAPQEITLRSGQRHRFTIVTGADIDRYNVSWSRVAGGVMVDQDTFMAGPTPGRYQLGVRDRRSGYEATCWVVIPAPAVSAITIAPRFSRVATGARIRLVTQMFDDQNAFVIGELRYRVLEGSARVAADGHVFVTGAPGTRVRIQVTEVHSQRSDVADIWVTPAGRHGR